MTTSNRSKRRQWLNRRRPERRIGAIERQRQRDERSSAEQLALLVTSGHGHCGEAHRLANQETPE